MKKVFTLIGNLKIAFCQTTAQKHYNLVIYKENTFAWRENGALRLCAKKSKLLKILYILQYSTILCKQRAKNIIINTREGGINGIF